MSISIGCRVLVLCMFVAGCAPRVDSQLVEQRYMPLFCERDTAPVAWIFSYSDSWDAIVAPMGKTSSPVQVDGLNYRAVYALFDDGSAAISSHGTIGGAPYLWLEASEDRRTRVFERAATFVESHAEWNVSGEHEPGLVIMIETASGARAHETSSMANSTRQEIDAARALEGELEPHASFKKLVQELFADTEIGKASSSDCRATLIPARSPKSP